MGARLSYPEVDLKDKVAIVTGGNTGIGYETGKALAFMGAHTIIACRSEERGKQVTRVTESYSSVKIMFCNTIHMLIHTQVQCAFSIFFF